MALLQWLSHFSVTDDAASCAVDLALRSSPPTRGSDHSGYGFAAEIMGGGGGGGDSARVGQERGREGE